MTDDSILSRLAFLPMLVLVYAILLIPVVIVILTSLTENRAPTIPYDGVTLEWYVSLFQNQRIMSAIVTSTVVGICAAVLAGVVGTITAFGFVRAELPYKESLATVMLLPIMISPVIAGLALLRFGGAVNVPTGYPLVIIGHAILTFPFVFLIVRARLLTFDDRLEDASMTLGATRLETVCNVTLPILSPAIVAGMLIAFVFSFGEFTATQFLVAPGSPTVPVIIYDQIQTGLSPEISALATVLVVIAIVLGFVGDLVT